MVVASASGFSLDGSNFIIADSVYAENGDDGSAFDGTFSPNFVLDRIVLDTNTDFTGTSAYAYYCFTLTDATGISDFWGGVTALDTGNYRINTATLDLSFDESAGFVKQTDNVRIFRDDDVRPALDPTTGGNGIEINWKNQVYVVEVSTGDAVNQATVQAAMTAQGYTTTRAPKIDGIDSIPTTDNSADIAAILTDTGTTLPAQISGVETKVDTAITDIAALPDNTADIAAILVDTGTTLPASIAAMQKYESNKRVWDKVANTVTVYDDDGVTPLQVFDVNEDLSEITPQ